MHFLSISVALIAYGHAAALIPAALPSELPSVSRVIGVKAPALPIHSFDTPKFARPLSLKEAVLGENASVTTIHGNLDKLKKMMPDLALPPAYNNPSTARDLDAELDRFEKRQSTCSSPRIRVEWDSYPSSDKQGFIDGIKCLMRLRPSGRYRSAQNRYEDLVALHQTLTPSVHGNAKFLLFHRYYLWTFEDVLRRECGFTRPIPWFDEPRYAGRFNQSSIFSDRWFGAMTLRGNCVTNGQFANLASYIGPGASNVRHCLSRNGDEAKTANTRASISDACNGRQSFADMASCAEGAAHAWGHNGIGAVMQDTYAAPADPVFWLHHAYIDRNFRQWQNSNSRERTATINGADANRQRLSLDYTISVGGIRPDIRIRDILNTQGSTLCYKYSY
jgi:tyrosinase